MKLRLRYVAGTWVALPVHQIIRLGSLYLHAFERELRESAPREPLTGNLLAACEHTCVAFDRVLAIVTGGAVTRVFESQFKERIEPLASATIGRPQ